MNMNTKRLDTDILESIKVLASKTLPADAHLILFGSQARGDANEGSDWDLLILLDRDTAPSYLESGEYLYAFMNLGWEIGAEINPMVFTAKQWKSQEHSLFYHNVQEEGIRLWA